MTFWKFIPLSSEIVWLAIPARITSQGTSESAAGEKETVGLSETPEMAMLPVSTIVPNPAFKVGILDSEPSSFKVRFLTVIPLSPISSVGIPVFVPSEEIFNSSMTIF